MVKVCNFKYCISEAVLFFSTPWSLILFPLTSPQPPPPLSPSRPRSLSLILPISPRQSSIAGLLVTRLRLKWSANRASKNGRHRQLLNTGCKLQLPLIECCHSMSGRVSSLQKKILFLHTSSIQRLLFQLQYSLHYPKSHQWTISHITTIRNVVSSSLFKTFRVNG